eukprot:11444835-Ditylum_brightwellii.AAC.1
MMISRLLRPTIESNPVSIGRTPGNRCDTFAGSLITVDADMATLANGAICFSQDQYISLDLLFSQSLLWRQQSK